MTFRLHPPDRLQLVFHRGVKVRENDDFVFVDTSGLLKWATNDRATLTLTTRDEAIANQAAIVNVVNAWMESTP